MPDAKRPSGPGRPSQEKQDAVAEREELDELAGTQPGAEEAARADPSVDARHAERAAHGGDDQEVRKRRR
jgi:hypothetical protein